MPSFRKYMTDIMYDRRGGIADKAVKYFMVAASWGYGAGADVLDVFYKTGIKRSRKAPIPIISLGNMTLGGTGKTPMAVFIAEYLRSTGKRPAILIRGYGKDENRMIGSMLPEVPVITGSDRIKSALTAAGLGCDCGILDDGFQHRRIRRDLDILLIDGISLFGNGCLFPRGVLREKMSALSRADMFILSKADQINDEKKRLLSDELGRYAPGKTLVTARHRPDGFLAGDGSMVPLDRVKGKDICLLSGIADPEYFRRLLSGLGANTEARFDLGDHHDYKRKDLENVAEECSRKGIKLIVTTEKDYVKIKDMDVSAIRDKILVLKIKIEILRGKESLIAGLDSVFTDKGS